MAFILSNLLSSLDSSIGLLDSSSDLLSILQAINVTNPTMGHGKSQKKTYDTVASLPAASVSLRGSLAVVQTIGNWAASGNADNGLYLCTGNDWALVQGLDSTGIRPVFQGSNFGYTSGGLNPSSTNVIDKFPFSSNSNATVVGDLTQAGRGSGGQSSQTPGYVSGNGASNVIDKFTISTDANATDVGDLTAGRYKITGQSDTVNGFGYTSGGIEAAPGNSNVIDKFSFTSNGNATDVGNLWRESSGLAGQSSSTHGYTTGGVKKWPPSYPSVYVNYNTIEKFPFVSGGNSSDISDLTQARQAGAGQSSTTHGYTSGGQPAVNVIDKFTFSADANATDLGDLTESKAEPSGQSSQTHGYASGGYTGSPSNVINKFPFSTDANATDIGNLTAGRYGVAGQQY